MKKHLQLINGLSIAALFLGLNSCRSTDTNNVLNSGISAVKINVVGDDYLDSGSLPQASLTKGINVGNGVERYVEMIDPSTIITTELSDASPLKNSAQASIGNSLALVTNGLGTGVRYRVIAYKDGEYQMYKDHTVGSELTIGLDELSNYNIVVYSYGSKDYLPAITAEEMKPYSSATTTYNNDNKDLMSWSGAYVTPAAGSDSQLPPIKLIHRTMNMKSVTVKSIGGYGNIISGTNLSLGTYYDAGNLNLSSGALTQSGNAQTDLVTDFIGLNSTRATAVGYPALMNVGTGTTGRVTGTIRTSAGGGSVPINSQFRIKAGTEKNLSVEVKKCGATVNGQYRLFMCYNLGASNTNPVTGSGGNWYQWGATAASGSTRYAPEYTSANPIQGWNQTPLASFTDPCSSQGAYHTPTKSEWEAVLSENQIYYDNDGLKIRPKGSSSDATPTLILPFTGRRGTFDGGALINSNYGYYWSSTGSTATNAYSLNFWAATVDDFYTKTEGFAIRCMAN